MEDDPIRLVILVRSNGTITTAMTDIQESPQSYVTGKSCRSPAELSTLLMNLGLEIESDTFRFLEWPGSVGKFVFVVPGTLEVMRSFGFLTS